MKFLALLLSFAVLQGEPGSNTPFIGKGVGGGDGRACNADLRVHPDTLDYDTTFIRCPKTPYQTIEKKLPNHYVFRLKTKQKRCLVELLVVDKSDNMEGWEVTSYPTESAWRKRDTSDAVQCVLY